MGDDCDQFLGDSYPYQILLTINFCKLTVSHFGTYATNTDCMLAVMFLEVETHVFTYGDSSAKIGNNGTNITHTTIAEILV